MRRFLIPFALLFLAGSLLAQQGHERYQLVRIPFPSDRDLRLLRSFDGDHFHPIAGGLEGVLTVGDVSRFRREGGTVTVVVDDLERYYADRSAGGMARMKETAGASSASLSTATNFALGSVGGYYSIPELRDQLVRMSDLFPSLAAAPVSIGTSGQGRDILAVRISARPESDTTVPEVLYDALLHAREPAGMTSLLYTMWSLLEGYGTDPEATYLLDHRALYFIPMANPDGYQENVRWYPSGGGLWRRNMRGDGDSGVDLNRNYGPLAYWNAANDGSSLSPQEDTYRGPAPFSEPETRAIRDFCLAHRFRMALNHHSYSNLLLYPFDWKSRTPEDSAYYRAASRELALENGFACGTSLETVGYAARGVADEWMYDFGNRDGKLISWAPETGSDDDGFWPAPERIVPMARANHPMNMRLAWMAGASPAITAVERLDLGGRPTMRITVANLGREPMDAGGEIGIDGGEGETSIPAMMSLESRTFDIPVPAIYAAAEAPRPELRIVLRYHDVPFVRAVKAMVHPLVDLFADNFDGGLSGNWSLGDWAAETLPGRGRVLSDSPYGDYIESDIDNVLETRNTISLQGMDAAELLFDASFEIQARSHSARIEVQRSGESDWHAVDGEYLQVPVGTNGGHTLLRGAQTEWHRYSVPLDSFAGSDIRLRITVHTPRAGSDGGFDGLSLDNLVIVGSAPVKLDVGDRGTELPAGVAVYPNPFANWLTLRSSDPLHAVRYRLINVLGETVRSGEALKQATIDTEGLPEGFYLLDAERGEGRVQQRVMLRR